MRTIATPVKIIQRESFAKDLAEIRRLVADREIGGIVYGLPLKMNGQEGDTATLVRAFAQKLDDHINLPYTFWDERLSSSAVESFLINNADMSRNKRKQVLDASAAAYILQGFLDSLKYL
jgi:putative Holliday junction resolvase